MRLEFRAGGRIIEGGAECGALRACICGALFGYQRPGAGGLDCQAAAAAARGVKARAGAGALCGALLGASAAGGIIGRAAALRALRGRLRRSPGRLRRGRRALCAGRPR